MELKKELKAEILRIVSNEMLTMGEWALEIRALGLSNEEVLRAMEEMQRPLDIDVSSIVEAAIALMKNEA